MTGAEFDGVDIDLLADYVGGALDGTPESERVAALIAGEPAWQEAYALLAPEMAAVGALLGDLPVEPMPADVVARLDAALATAGGPVATVTVDEAAPGVPKSVSDLDVRRRKRGRHRWLRIAAPIGIAAGAVAFLGYGLAGPESASDDAGSSAAAPAAGEAMVNAIPALTMTSGLDYTLGTLGQTLKRATDTPRTMASEDSAGINAADEQGLARLRAPAALLDCLNAIAAENGAGPITTESADYARFEGQEALVVRFTADNGAWAWASGADCGLAGGGADTLGKVPVR
ncbi:hypothetical protein GCM10010168_40840 [Actinoplanes ianthinogenes]|uniref:Anti-sigma factor n=1 Tax=Actinoplanes ianthinogenes TaxID=122358 RepID=A0ABN6CHR6_9ACTN|nr:hypothetical protein [Actinoplanes ianthinogenes]BCJ43608.1 hypothetical protein Aiant_42650 [Actinoplanes ianthinogenes]GGR18900.1 hypothetical protein GCM10010168_40840 [Actinoplanes ianthinogenes]